MQQQQEINIYNMRSRIQQLVLEAVRTDPRIVGCVDYGSASQGRDDKWSDLDLALFIQDSELTLFKKDWKEWAGQFGTLMLAYIGGVGHPWAVYDAQPVPLRVDFAFYPASTLNRILDWPNSPVREDIMVLHDQTGGELTRVVKMMVGQSLAPDDLQKAFEQVAGDFWYYCLRTHSKLMREQHWAARHDFNFMITGNLLALLRIECGAVSFWRGTSAAVGIEFDLPEERLRQLSECIPGPKAEDLQAAIRHAASLGLEVCSQIADAHRWDWSADLAERVLTIYS